MKLRPLSAFLQPTFNAANQIPMSAWLTFDLTEQQKDRLRTLGNIAVPHAAALAGEILERVTRAV